MRIIKHSLVLFIFATLGFQCSREDLSGIYEGKVEIIGVCGIKVVSITKGNVSRLPANSYEPTWTNEFTNVNYTNAFTIGNKCEMMSLTEGDKLVFRVKTQPSGPCNTCMAYSASPYKSLSIEVISRTPGQ